MNDDDKRRQLERFEKFNTARRRWSAKRKIMSIYPIKFRSISLDHRGGTKSYHLTIIEAESGNSVFISRWGKTGSFGETKVEVFDSPVKAQKAWDKKEREKSRSGYAQEGATRERKAESQADLPATVGRELFNKMGASAVKHLDPTFDTSGMREADAPQYEEETGRRIDTSRKANLDAAIAAQKAADERSVTDAYANNPNYGSF